MNWNNIVSGSVKHLINGINNLINGIKMHPE